MIEYNVVIIVVFAVVIHVDVVVDVVVVVVANTRGYEFSNYVS